MKLAFLIMGAALINPVFAGEGIFTNQAKPFELWLVPQGSSAPEGWAVPGDLGTNGFGFSSISTNLPALNFKAGELSIDGKRSPQGHLKPGVYKTSPYTCLVLVPGPHSDDACVSAPGTAGTEKMPGLQPGLKFIPYSFPEK